MCWILGEEHHCRTPSTNFGGRVTPFTRDLCLWLVLCLTVIWRNVMPIMKISTKCMCFFQLTIIVSASAFYPSRPQKKSAKPSAFYTFENPQVRRSAFYRRPPWSAKFGGDVAFVMSSCLVALIMSSCLLKSVLWYRRNIQEYPLQTCLCLRRLRWLAIITDWVNMHRSQCTRAVVDFVFLNCSR